MKEETQVMGEWPSEVRDSPATGATRGSAKEHQLRAACDALERGVGGNYIRRTWSQCHPRSGGARVSRLQTHPDQKEPPVLQFHKSFPRVNISTRTYCTYMHKKIT